MGVYNIIPVTPPNFATVLCVELGPSAWFWEKPCEKEAGLEHTEWSGVFVRETELEQKLDRGSRLGSDLARPLRLSGAGPSRNSRPGNARASRPSAVTAGSSTRKAEF